jgi:hypothetical protein
MTFRDLLWRAANKLGYFPQEVPLSNAFAYQLVEGLNLATHLAWGHFAWPRAVKPRECVPVEGRVLYGEGEDVFGVFVENPEVKLRPRRVPFVLGSHEGSPCVFLPGCALETVWVTVRSTAPQFTAEVWRPDRSFLVGELTYSPSTGQCYRAELPSVGVGVESVDHWSVVAVPSWLAEPIKAGAVASMEATESQLGTAERLSAAMEVLLDFEADKAALISPFS